MGELAVHSFQLTVDSLQLLKIIELTNQPIIKQFSIYSLQLLKLTNQSFYTNLESYSRGTSAKMVLLYVAIKMELISRNKIRAF